MNIASRVQSLTDLLEFENDNELIGLTCPTTGLPLWPLIRVPMIRTIMSDLLYKNESLTTPGSKVNILKVASKATVSSIHNFGNRIKHKKSIVIQSTGLGNYSNNGMVSDRLIGYFTEAMAEHTIVYQDKPMDSIFQKYSFGPILHKNPRNIINKIYSKLAINNKQRNLANRVINRAAENATMKFGYIFSNEQLQILSNLLATHLTVLPYASDTYANWFTKNGFRLLLKEDACYGGSAVSIIHAAKLCGMVVAEYQHGAISKGHDGYNVADALATSQSFKRVLPDYLLTYGNWWSNQTNMPVQKIAIGNPHLTEMLGFLGAVSHERSQVLILGDGIETNMYLNLASQVFEMVRVQGMKVVFRPHPFEREKIKTSILPYGVRLDIHEDIYSSLKESSVVISELSTGLFEAIGLVDKVLLWETDKSRFAFPEIPFNSFSTIDELESIVTSKNSLHNRSCTVPATEMWEPNWKQNYLRFVEEIVGK